LQTQTNLDDALKAREAEHSAGKKTRTAITRTLNRLNATQIDNLNGGISRLSSFATVDVLFNFVIDIALQATPTNSKTKTKEETNERIERDVEETILLVKRTVDRLKTGAPFEDPISTINIEAIRKLSNNTDSVEQRVDAIEKTVEMGTGCQTAISKRLTKGLILTKTFGKKKPSELCRLTGLHRVDIRKATELVKIWRTARNLLNFNLGNIPASTLYKFSRHFLQVVGGLDPVDRQMLNLSAASQEANNGLADAVSDLFVGSKRSCSESPEPFSFGLKRSKQPGEAEAAATKDTYVPSAATMATFEGALAIGGVTIEPPEEVSDDDARITVQLHVDGARDIFDGVCRTETFAGFLIDDAGHIVSTRGYRYFHDTRQICNLDATFEDYDFSSGDAIYINHHLVQRVAALVTPESATRAAGARMMAAVAAPASTTTAAGEPTTREPPSTATTAREPSTREPPISTTMAAGEPTTRSPTLMVTSQPQPQPLPQPQPPIPSAWKWFPRMLPRLIVRNVLIGNIQIATAHTNNQITTDLCDAHLAASLQSVNRQLEVAGVLLAVAVLLSLVVVILAVELEVEGIVRCV
jgi:hypothetical protein